MTSTYNPLTWTRHLGVCIAWQRGSTIRNNVLARMAPNLYMNWLYKYIRDGRYLPTAFSLSTGSMSEYIAYAQTWRSLNRLWLLGNEPNLASTYIPPDVAAASVRRWQNEVGGVYAAPAVVLWAGWQDWLNGYLASGGPVPTFWNIHVYDQWPYPPIQAFREWMQSHGVVRKMVISETAAPWSGVEANKEYMTKIAEAIWVVGDVQLACWYSAPDDYWGLWPDTNLMNHEGTELTELGEHWLSLQPGGANNPAATATPEPTMTPDMQLWLPHAGRGE